MPAGPTMLMLELREACCGLGPAPTPRETGTPTSSVTGIDYTANENDRAENRRHGSYESNRYL